MAWVGLAPWILSFFAFSAARSSSPETLVRALTASLAVRLPFLKKVPAAFPDVVTFRPLTTGGVVSLGCGGGAAGTVGVAFTVRGGVVMASLTLNVTALLEPSLVAASFWRATTV